MTRRRRLQSATLVLVALAAGCQPTLPERPDAVEGQPCAPDGIESCATDASMLACIERQWTAVECDAYCSPFEAIGCDGGCQCSARCEPGCRPDGSYVICDGNEPRLESCDELCAALPGAPPFLTCEWTSFDPACQCDPAGLPCDPQPSRCLDSEFVLTCDDGRWEVEHCVESCEPPSHGRCWQAIGGAACRCE